MGLPLFVAPVESDLPSKATSKNNATSPSRSGIRRHVRPDSRERRAAIRRHMSIRDRLASGSLRQSNMLTGRGIEPQQSILDDSPVTDGLRRPTPFREVLREVVRSDARNRERFEEQLHSLFTGTPLQNRITRENEPEENIPPWWTVDPALQTPGTRPAGPQASRTEGIGMDIRSRSRQRMPPLVQQPTLPRPLSEVDGASRRRRVESRNRALGLDGGESRRSMIIQRMRDVNGLGDRERSLSPEGWDTILTTMTPDPQPPSAGSSFASTVASQSAGVSTGTSLTTPDAVEGAGVDQACESGCENSDTEGADYEHPDFARIRRRREEMRRVRVRIPDYNLDGPVDGPVDGPIDGPTDGPVDGPVDGPSDGPFSRRTARFSGIRQQNIWDVRPTGDEIISDTLGSGNLSLSQLRRPRHGWVGHLSVGTSDDEQGTERRSLNRESSAASANNTSPGDEELAGMRHIVQSLARREDIPDEWWAEAGLSRTLP